MTHGLSTDPDISVNNSISSSSLEAVVNSNTSYDKTSYLHHFSWIINVVTLFSCMPICCHLYLHKRFINIANETMSTSFINIHIFTESRTSSIKDDESSPLITIITTTLQRRPWRQAPTLKRTNNPATVFFCSVRKYPPLLSYHRQLLAGHPAVPSSYPSALSHSNSLHWSFPACVAQIWPLLYVFLFLFF